MQYGVHKMNTQEAWKVTLGNSDLVVAVIDTGVDYNHPEFAGRMIKGPNFAYKPAAPAEAGKQAPKSDIPQPGPDDPLDDLGHGTHVAGIIAPAADGKGVVGVAPRVKIMAIKVLAASGGGTTWDVARGIHHAYTNGAKIIINLSLGGSRSNDFVEQLVADARRQGCLVLAAAGNNGWNPDGPPVNLGLGSLPHTIYPAMYKGALAVGATDDQDKLATFSNYGRKVSVVAPGVKIVSTMPLGPSVMTKQAGFMNQYDAMSGTSMAHPHGGRRRRAGDECPSRLDARPGAGSPRAHGRQRRARAVLRSRPRQRRKGRAVGHGRQGKGRSDRVQAADWVRTVTRIETGYQAANPVARMLAQAIATPKSAGAGRAGLAPDSNGLAAPSPVRVITFNTAVGNSKIKTPQGPASRPTTCAA